MQIFLFILSFLIVGFGQPAWSVPLSITASLVGYALCFSVLIRFSEAKKRFWLATLWFTFVQLIQLSWFLSHPFLYIVAIYFLFAFLMGLQFGIVGLLITPARISSFLGIAFIASIWTLLEWSRLFFFSGFSLNMAGLTLTGTLYSLQFASLWGIYGLSFWVILTNLCALYLWQQFSIKRSIIFGLCALLPYIYGWIQIQTHEQNFSQTEQSINALLVHTAFPADLEQHRNTTEHVLTQWEQILQAIAIQKDQKIDLVVLPEYVVLCGTYSCRFPYERIVELFKNSLGQKSLQTLPNLNGYFAKKLQQEDGASGYFVNNAFIAQGISNYFQSGLLIGLEDAEHHPERGILYYSAAQYFEPQTLLPKRYEKRILLPFGEYIPFEWCRALAARYGVMGSFEPGQSAKVFAVKGIPFGTSICYEETHGNLMRENKILGANFLLNLTSDVWYPYSRLAQQHFDHARLRTVENGIALIRASNVGISGAVDSLGRVIQLEYDHYPYGQHRAISVQVPLYTYQTLYSKTGDWLILIISCSFIILYLLKRILFI